MRYFLHLSYHGRKFHGWQCQKNHISIQEVLERNLTKMLKAPTKIHGCGRTDAGVSASQYFCTIDIANDLDYDFIFRINKMLPHSIVIHDLIPVHVNANAQLDAVKRTYSFYCHFEENPLLQDLSNFYVEKDLDFQAMEKAANLLLGINDFHSFCKSLNIYNGFTDCNITDVKIQVNAAKTRMLFQITGNRFLRGMVRILLANLMRVGTGDMSLEHFEQCLKNKKDTGHYQIAKPQGLYLSKVEYEYIDVAQKEHILAF